MTATSKDPLKNGSYWQDDKPVDDQTEAEGHAVRAGYLYSAVADVAALTGDKQMLAAVDSIWDNLVSRKLYVQGGAGAIPQVSVMAMTTNCLILLLTMKPVQRLPMYSGMSVCLNYMVIQNMLMCWKRSCIMD